jgi:hypothetical protein
MDSYEKRNVTGGTRGIGTSEDFLIDGVSFCEIDKIKLAQRLLGKITSINCIQNANKIKKVILLTFAF